MSNYAGETGTGIWDMGERKYGYKLNEVRENSCRPKLQMEVSVWIIHGVILPLKIVLLLSWKSDKGDTSAVVLGNIAHGKSDPWLINSIWPGNSMYEL